MDNYMNLELSRHIESRVGSIDWNRRARKYFNEICRRLKVKAEGIADEI